MGDTGPSPKRAKVSMEVEEGRIIATDIFRELFGRVRGRLGQCVVDCTGYWEAVTVLLRKVQSGEIDLSTLEGRAKVYHCANDIVTLLSQHVPASATVQQRRAVTRCVSGMRQSLTKWIKSENGYLPAVRVGDIVVVPPAAPLQAASAAPEEPEPEPAMSAEAKARMADVSAKIAKAVESKRREEFLMATARVIAFEAELWKRVARGGNLG